MMLRLFVLLFFCCLSCWSAKVSTPRPPQLTDPFPSKGNQEARKNYLEQQGWISGNDQPGNGLPEYVYRVLRGPNKNPPEYPAEGIGPKNSEATVSPYDHIADSKQETAFISLTASVRKARQWAAAYGTRLIKIETRKLLEAGAIIGDFRNGGNLDERSNAFNYARNANELLLYSNEDVYIASEAIQEIVDYTGLGSRYRKRAQQANRRNEDAPYDPRIQTYTVQDVSKAYVCKQ